MMRLAFWTCLVAIVILSVSPASQGLPTTGWDKTNHFLGFGVLTFLGCRAYAAAVVTVLVGLMAFGGLVEVMQWFTPDRQAEWGDLLADAIGIAMGAGLGRCATALASARRAG